MKMAGRCRKQNSSRAVIIALFLCLVLGTFGGVFAYLISRPAPLSNQFTPAEVSCSVEELFRDGVKSDVKVRNTGNVNAYLRAAVIVTFVDDGGKVLAGSPKEGVNYTVVWGSSGWTLGSDGFWYYADAVSPDGVTAPLIQSASPISVPDGYRLNLQIVASAIQSDPEAAVTAAWGITPVNGKILPN